MHSLASTQHCFSEPLLVHSYDLSCDSQFNYVWTEMQSFWIPESLRIYCHSCRFCVGSGLPLKSSVQALSHSSLLHDPDLMQFLHSSCPSAICLCRWFNNILSFLPKVYNMVIQWALGLCPVREVYFTQFKNSVILIAQLFILKIVQPNIASCDPFY